MDKNVPLLYSSVHNDTPDVYKCPISSSILTIDSGCIVLVGVQCICLISAALVNIFNASIWCPGVSLRRAGHTISFKILQLMRGSVSRT